jgi:hypothetical protein
VEDREEGYPLAGRGRSDDDVAGRWHERAVFLPSGAAGDSVDVVRGQVIGRGPCVNSEEKIADRLRLQYRQAS